MEAEIKQIEHVVRAVYYEALPYESVRDLSPRQIAHLGEMLGDLSEAPHHGNIVLALGMSEDSAAFELLEAYAATPPAGAVDRSTYRARSRIPLAMGHLARRERRALQWLLTRAESPERDPGWSFRRQHGARLSTVLREQVLTGLALSGKAEAGAALEQAQRGADDRRRRHAIRLRSFHTRMVSEGPQKLLGSGAAE